MIINNSSSSVTQQSLPLSKNTTSLEATTTTNSNAAAQIDNATLSAAALALASGKTSTASSSGWLSTIAHSDISQADQLAYNYAYVDDMPLVDLSSAIAGTGPVRYVSTGQAVTAESDAAFSAEAAKLKQGRIDLYESEKAKGTPAADILDNIVSYMNANASADHLSLMQWDRVTGQA